MDLVSSVAAVSASNSASQLRTAVELGVLKKAIDIQAAGVLALVQAVPTPSSTASGEAGGIVNTWA